MSPHRQSHLARSGLDDRLARLSSSNAVSSMSLAIEKDALTALLRHTGGGASSSFLLQRFRSLGHVLTADDVDLAKAGLAQGDIGLLRLVHAIARLLAAGVVRARPVAGTSQALLDYLQTSMAYEPVEQLRVLFLDCRNHIIADEVMHRGTVNHTPVYPREVVRRALLLNASSLIVVHNHPSGDPTPSQGDVEMTRELKKAAATLDLQLHDHIVIGQGKHASLRSLGLL